MINDTKCLNDIATDVRKVDELIGNKIIDTSVSIVVWDKFQLHIILTLINILTYQTVFPQ